MSILLVAALLGIGAPSAEQVVEVGRVNLASLPRVQTTGQIAMEGLVTRVEKMIESGTCQFKGQRARRFDIVVPYAVLLEPQGAVNRVVVNETGCEPLEILVGEVALARARNGHFRPTGGGKAQWQVGEINFTLQ